MKRVLRRLDFSGITAAPSQVVGAVRLVPLLRREPIDGLRLYSISSSAARTQVRVDPKTTYSAYVPHAMVAELGDAPPQASAGAKLVSSKTSASDLFRIEVIPRLARRQGPGRLRFLPQHLGIEAYLSLGFRGPNAPWSEYSQRVLSHGLSPRGEWMARGTQIRGFADALRVFEMHEEQVGVLVFVADTLASAFVTPHPDDYRQLHGTLLHDMYADLIVQYSVLYPEAPALWEPIEDGAVRSLDDLARCIDGLRRRWSEFSGLMASGLLDAMYTMEQVNRLGGFSLWRFTPTYRTGEENHVGDMIADSAGRLAYLSTVRLSAAQARRGYLLANLVETDWNLDDCAKALQATRSELVARLRNNGLGYLLRAHV